MSIAWGLSHYSRSFREGNRAQRSCGMRRIQARVALAATPAGSVMPR
jgi:hypothetical protein